MELLKHCHKGTRRSGTSGLGEHILYTQGLMTNWRQVEGGNTEQEDEQQSQITK